jgi:hypothetical protein
MLRIAGTALLATVMAAQAAPNQYLCITESVGGLRYSPATKSWRAQAFTPGNKYILRRVTDDEVKGWNSLFKKVEVRDLKLEERQMYGVGDWAFVKFGENNFGISLRALCHENSGDISWFCEPSPFSPIVSFITDSRRFEFVGGSGAYVGQGRQERLRSDPEKLKREPPGLVYDPSHPDDLFVEIGTCSPF